VALGYLCPLAAGHGESCLSGISIPADGDRAAADAERELASLRARLAARQAAEQAEAGAREARKREQDEVRRTVPAAGETVTARRWEPAANWWEKYPGQDPLAAARSDRANWREDTLTVVRAWDGQRVLIRAAGQEGPDRYLARCWDDPQYWTGICGAPTGRGTPCQNDPSCRAHGGKAAS
jgi:hypothetical protein